MLIKQKIQWIVIFSVLILFTISSVQAITGHSETKVALAEVMNSAHTIVFTNQENIVLHPGNNNINYCYPKINGIKLSKDYIINIGKLNEEQKSQIIVRLNPLIECRIMNFRVPLISLFHVS